MNVVIQTTTFSIKRNKRRNMLLYLHLVFLFYLCCTWPIVLGAPREEGLSLFSYKQSRLFLSWFPSTFSDHSKPFLVHLVSETAFDEHITFVSTHDKDISALYSAFVDIFEQETTLEFTSLLLPSSKFNSLLWEDRQKEANVKDNVHNRVNSAIILIDRLDKDMSCLVEPPLPPQPSIFVLDMFKDEHEEESVPKKELSSLDELIYHYLVCYRMYSVNDVCIYLFFV